SLRLDLGEDIALAQDEQLLTIDLDLRAAVLAVEDLVALGDVQRDALRSVLVVATLADGEDLALLRLLLGGVGEDDAAGSRLLLFDRPHDQTIAQGLELHTWTSIERGWFRLRWHSTGQSAKRLRREYRTSRPAGKRYWHSLYKSANEPALRS